MSLVTPGQLAAERHYTSETYTDICQRLVHTPADSDRGPGTGEPTYPAGVSIPCSFQGQTEPDAMEQTQVPITRADLYLPYNATLNPSDRVKMTHLLGEAVASPQTFSVVEGPLMDGNVLHAVIELVTDGSDA